MMLTNDVEIYYHENKSVLAIYEGVIYVFLDERLSMDERVRDLDYLLGETLRGNRRG